MNDNKGKGVAVVTGATGNIGPAICSTLRGDGWTVVASERSRESFAAADTFLGGIDCDHAVFADLMDVDQSEDMIRSIESDIGPISLLVHAAVYNGRADYYGSVTREQYDAFMSINLTMPFFLTQLALDSLKSCRGSVVFFSSVLVKTLTKRNTIYAMSKAATEKMTQALALELEDTGVRANCVRVGAIGGHTPFRKILEALPGEAARRLYLDIIPDYTGGFGDSQPSRLRGRPQDIAGAVRYLASPDSELVNGAVLPVDGAFNSRTRSFGKNSLEIAKEKAAEWLKREGFTDLLKAVDEVY